MYIGPWQELNLSRARVISEKQGVIVRADIEKALLSTLDEESAKKALDALFPSSNQSETQALSDRPPRQLHSIAPAHQRRQILHQRVTEDLRFPPISGSSTPSSVRSTVSEPIQRSNQQKTRNQQPLSDRTGRTERRQKSTGSLNNPSGPKLPRLQLSNLTERKHEGHLNFEISVENAQSNLSSGYDASSVVSLLKLERSQRPPKPNLSQYWKWKNAANPSEKPSDISKDLTEKKLEMVKKMHHLYANGQTPMDSHSAEKLSSPIGVPISPIRQARDTVNPERTEQHVQLIESIPSSPRIDDMDLTTEDFQYISKYFKVAGGVEDKLKTKTGVSAGATTSEIKFPDISETDKKSTRLHTESSTPKKTLLGESKRGAEQVTQERAMSPMLDELYMGGGADGLLKWSMNLDIDDF